MFLPTSHVLTQSNELTVLLLSQNCLLCTISKHIFVIYVLVLLSQCQCPSFHKHSSILLLGFIVICNQSLCYTIADSTISFLYSFTLYCTDGTMWCAYAAANGLVVTHAKLVSGQVTQLIHNTSIISICTLKSRLQNYVTTIYLLYYSLLIRIILSISVFYRFAQDCFNYQIQS